MGWDLILIIVLRTIIQQYYIEIVLNTITWIKFEEQFFSFSSTNR
tara:strand:- start:599 stop:733 length:135 start_codon:yes stop_codon:yes gene_type:complete